MKRQKRANTDFEAYKFAVADQNLTDRGEKEDEGANPQLIEATIKTTPVNKLQAAKVNPPSPTNGNKFVVDSKQLKEDEALIEQMFNLGLSPEKQLEPKP